jgi:hypothetical protein
MKGLAYYCFKHDQGCLVVGDKIPQKLNKACRDCKNCQWEDIGSFNIVMRHLILSIPSEKFFDEQAGGWLIKYFKHTLYNKNMELIHYHDVIDDI